MYFFHSLLISSRPEADPFFTWQWSVSGREPPTCLPAAAARQPNLSFPFSFLPLTQEPKQNQRSHSPAPPCSAPPPSKGQLQRGLKGLARPSARNLRV